MNLEKSDMEKTYFDSHNDSNNNIQNKMGHNSCDSLSKSMSHEIKDMTTVTRDKTELDALALNPTSLLPNHSNNKENITNAIQQGSIRPTDYTDAGNAVIFSKIYKNKIIYVRSIGWMIWNNKRWISNDLEATTLAIKLTEKMLEEAMNELREAKYNLEIAECSENIGKMKESKARIKEATGYYKHVLSTREAPGISRMLILSKPNLHVELDTLDSNCFALNTLEGIVDLKTGNLTPHDPLQFCTKITSTELGSNNENMWLDFLNIITCGDIELSIFLQEVAGMLAIGKVFMENINIAYGNGSNGKSTFFNTLASVLNDYSGTISAEILTIDKRNKGASLAELKSKRMIIASELDEDKQISISILKQIASTDRITAERKYRDPESFVPSHSVVLYTNHLPKIGSSDNGTWRRLVVIPFNAKISLKNDIKNFAEKLVKDEGETILKWIIDGAIKFCNNNYRLTTPMTVTKAIECYRNDNDWLKIYLHVCCICGTGNNAKSGEMYGTYKEWAKNNGEHIKHIRDFNTEMIRHGFDSIKNNKGAFWQGVGLKPKDDS